MPATSPRHRGTRRAAAALVAALLLAGCGSTATTTAPTTTSPAAPTGPGGAGTTAGTAAPGGAAPAGVVFPGADWETTDATAAGFDQAALDAIAARAEGGGSNCFLVTRGGKIVDERYWNGKTATSAQEVFSATKSYSSTLVGIAQAEGKLKVTDKASQYIPEWVGTPSEDVTIENLLKNDSGRHWDFKTDYTDMAVGAKDKTAFAIGLGQDAAPGTVWAYNNSAIQTLSAILKKATGMEAADYAQQKLLGPIGMTNSKIRQDASGGTLTFMGLQSTCRDMARFGHLMLEKGNWDGTQVVPEAWVDAATGRSSQELNAAYGYLWWLNRKGHVASPVQPTTGQAGGDQEDAQMVPGAPEDMFWALGLGDQIIAVDPGSDTVVVRLGGANSPDGAARFTTKDTSAVVTEALR